MTNNTCLAVHDYYYSYKDEMVADMIFVKHDYYYSYNDNV